MAKKYVYLFELDSVRKTDREVIAGQWALYDEIVKNGNVVVLTYNQLIDSRAFFSLFGSEEYAESIVQLFRLGAVKISQYGETRSVVQYLLDSLGREKDFIFSALPIKTSQKRLTALVRRSLIYSDLSELDTYRKDTESTSDEKLRDLFAETCEENGSLTESASTLPLTEIREVIRSLYGMLLSVLRLSTLEDIYIRPKDPALYENCRLADYLYAVAADPAAFKDPRIIQAIPIIRNLQSFKKRRNDRTGYLKELRELSSLQSSQAEACCFAEILVDLCCNYAYEASICNISKHYNIAEMTSGRTADSFFPDLALRFEEAWDNGFLASDRFLVPESNAFEEFTDLKKLPDLTRAVRLAASPEYRDQADAEKKPEQIERYESHYEEQQKTLRKTVLKHAGKRFAILSLYLLIVICTDLLLQIIQNVYDGNFFALLSLSRLLRFLSEAVIFIIISELVGYLVFRCSKKHLLSLSDSVSGIKELISDTAGILHRAAKTHHNTSCKTDMDTEKAAAGVRIDHIRPKELRQYITLKSSEESRIRRLFSPSAAYPIADVSDPSVIKKIIRSEELFDCQYGVIYQSRFHSLIVDPVLSSDGSIYPYERICPSKDDGVVMIPKYKDHFLILRQYRHALRQIQYSFPRGFAETVSSDDPSLKENALKNAVRELSEEISAKILKEPTEIGRITPDSGLASERVHVFLVEIEKYDPDQKTEGIIGIEEKSEQALSQMAGQGLIEDGFTLGAWFLYRLKEEII